MTGTTQFNRKATLLVVQGDRALDLSELRFRFDVKGADTQSPNSVAIRVYNLSEQTQQQVKREYRRVVLSAGYESAFGVIFDGTIKQFRTGRESATETYLDILAADGDVGYNFGVCNRSWPAGSTARDHLQQAANDMDLTLVQGPDLTGTNPGALARGKVGFGMARDLARKAADTLGATWSIQNGTLQVIPLQGYLESEALVMNSRTGMIGIPEQTDVGVRVTSLLNPKIRIGTRLRLNNRDITQLEQADKNNPVPFNQWTGIQYAAKIADGADGDYRVYVVEHTGDTRGNDWTSDITCLLIAPASKKVEARN